MKLYIATTTLNIDNILATESIAPFSFYSRRDYGYKTFYQVNIIPYSNVLILFSKIPSFNILDKNNESYPMVLEVDIDDSIIPSLKLIDKNDTCSIYSVDNVIRLAPFNCKVLFFQPNVLNFAMNICSGSMTNKLGDRFVFKLAQGEFNLDSYFFNKYKIDDVCCNYREKILYDNRLNKVKGFIFGYYIGLSKSLSPNSAKLLKLQKRIYDIISTIKSNGGLGNNKFYNELIKLDDEFRKNDPSTKRCRIEWENYLSELRIPSESLEKLLSELDTQNIIKNNFLRMKGLSSGVNLRSYGLSNLDLYCDALKKHTINILNDEYKNNVNKLFVDEVFDLDPTCETCMLASDDDDSTLFNKFIDNILWHGITPTVDSLRTDRYNIATDITVLTRDIWVSNHWIWEGSSARMYMNALRQNISSFTSFTIEDQENIILQSIAAYILKGEDYESLVQLCEVSCLYDYRYVFALWGATQGYVKISRSILLPLLNSLSFSKVYKDILFLLFKIEYKGDLPHIQQMVAISSKINSNINTSKKTLGLVENIRLFISKKKKNKKQIDSLEEAFIENGDQVNYEIFFDRLKERDGWKTTKEKPVKLLVDMVEYFCSNEFKMKFVESKSTKKNSIKEKGIFDGIVDENIVHVSNRSFYNNPQTIDDLKFVLGEKIENVLWFFEDLSKEKAKRKYLKEIDVENNKYVIDTFCKTIKKRQLVDGDNIEKIRRYFYKKYRIS